MSEYRDYVVRYKKSTPANANKKPVGTYDKDPGDNAFGPKAIEFEVRRNLERARAAKGMNRKQLAEAAYIKESQLAAWESGTAPIPDAVIPKLEKVLGTKLVPEKDKK